jgi:hypothetical protein
MATHDFDFTDPYGNKDRKSLYSNQDNYFNNWSSLTQSEEVVEELSIQQTKYDHRSLPSLRSKLGYLKQKVFSLPFWDLLFEILAYL